MTTNDYEKELLATIATELGQTNINLIHLIRYVDNEAGVKELKTSHSSIAMNRKGSQ